LALVVISFFIATVLIALISIFNEKKSFFKKPGFGGTFFSLPVIWLCIVIDLSLSLSLMFAVGFTDWLPSGIGLTLFGYGFSGIAVSTSPVVLIVACFVLLFSYICPSLIFAVGMTEKRENEVIQQKGRIRQAFGLIICLILTIGIFTIIFISLLFHWSTYTNFFMYMISDFDGQSAWFFICVIVSLVCLIIALILINAIFFTKKLRTDLKISEEIQGGSKQKVTSSKLFFYWFIYWTLLWIFLSISLALGVTIIPEGIILSSVGLLLYFNTAQLTSLIGIIMGMIVVFYYSHLKSKELSMPVPPRARSLSGQIEQFVTGFKDGVSEDDIQVYFQMLNYSKSEVNEEIRHLSNDGIIIQTKIGKYKFS